MNASRVGGSVGCSRCRLSGWNQVGSRLPCPDQLNVNVRSSQFPADLQFICQLRPDTRHGGRVRVTQQLAHAYEIAGQAVAHRRKLPV